MTEKLKPDYDKPCDNCGAVPTVTVVDENDNITHDFEMCGVCTFGEAAMLDPENWGEIHEM